MLNKFIANTIAQEKEDEAKERAKAREQKRVEANTKRTKAQAAFSELSPQQQQEVQRKARNAASREIEVQKREKQEREKQESNDDIEARFGYKVLQDAKKSAAEQIKRQRQAVVVVPKGKTPAETLQLRLGDLTKKMNAETNEKKKVQLKEGIELQNLFIKDRIKVEEKLQNLETKYNSVMKKLEEEDEKNNSINSIVIMADINFKYDDKKNELKEQLDYIESMSLQEYDKSIKRIQPS